ncbi:uncharacterized protein LOC116231463, partial [Phasianus colchicus]|uniref:uncharacterized protein LOC116231463 n=1 Tax=Phasianus colchicus TaxID=9054 RepID=UPI00129D2F51
MGMHCCRDAGTMGMQWGCIGAGMQAPWGCNGDVMGMHCCRDAGTNSGAWPCCCCRTPETPLRAPIFCTHGAASMQLPCAALPSLLEQHFGTQPTTDPCGGQQWWDFPRGWGCHAAPPADLEALLADLSSFLLLLDRENLSAAARAKKQSVGELLQRLQGPAAAAAAEDAEYMMMRCLSPSSGTRQCRGGAGAAVMDARGGRACERLQGSTQSSQVGRKARGSSPPPPPEGSYEDTKPL